MGIGAGMIAGSVSLVGFGIDKDAVRCKRCLPTSRHINTNPGSMSDIVISKCLRAHYLYEAFRAGLAEVQHPQTMLRADFLEDWP